MSYSSSLILYAEKKRVIFNEVKRSGPGLFISNWNAPLFSALKFIT